MSLQNEVVEKKVKKSSFFKKYFLKKAKWIMGVLVLILVILIGIRTGIFFDNKTTKIGFEDIGEFATQAAYCTEIDVIDNPIKVWGVSIPFTQSKYIYSYDIVIKAGFDFSEIEWDANEKENIIEVKLPEAKVLSSEIDLDSFKVYHEQESAFNKITMTENNESLKRLKEKAEEESVANGLLKNARTNAETVLTGFFAKSYDLDKYEIVFKDK